jgi:methylmalonyl-CoA mutase N-terminal domain/subunit
MVEAIERGFPQREIAEASYRFQQAVERRDKVVVGVNDFTEDDEPPVQTLYIDEAAADRQLARLQSVRRSRDAGQVGRTLDALRAAAAGTGKLMPRILDAVRAYATLGEMCDALREVWGEYEETPII